MAVAGRKVVERGRGVTWTLVGEWVQRKEEVATSRMDQVCGKGLWQCCWEQQQKLINVETRPLLLKGPKALTKKCAAPPVA